ncbi:hypothetical protein [Micromonospora tarensis]|nr:hypothetical protein [Micromonospora tarensis]
MHTSDEINVWSLTSSQLACDLAVSALRLAVSTPREKNFSRR